MTRTKKKKKEVWDGRLKSEWTEEKQTTNELRKKNALFLVSIRLYPETVVSWIFTVWFSVYWKSNHV